MVSMENILQNQKSKIKKLVHMYSVTEAGQSPCVFQCVFIRFYCDFLFYQQPKNPSNHNLATSDCLHFLLCNKSKLYLTFKMLLIA